MAGNEGRRSRSSDDSEFFIRTSLFEFHLSSSLCHPPSAIRHPPSAQPPSAISAAAHCHQRSRERRSRNTMRAVLDDPSPVAIPITDTLDLHPFQPSEIKDVAREYLIEAHARGLRQVRLIHGRGIGVQRERIRALLETLDFVEAYHDADGSGGGWGSTVVLLASNSLNQE
jgi:DNA-nicking Smr family endonuclease